MTTFLQTIIPVSLPVWLGFFLVPCVGAMAGQVVLCRRCKKQYLKFLPLYMAGVIAALVLLCRFTGFLSAVIGGFVSLLLLGSATFLIGGSLAGWIISGIFAVLHRKEMHIL